jgi:tetratricopeptide (TPR) repeat protein
VFVAQDAAFSDCPQCGSMAIPAGAPTVSDATAITPNPFADGDFSGEVTDEERVARSAASADLAPETPPNVFGNMIDEGHGGNAQELGDGPKVREIGGMPASMALTRGEDPAPFNEPTAAMSDQDIDDFDPFADMSLDTAPPPDAAFDPFAAVPDAEVDLERAETRVQDVPEELRAAAAAHDPELDGPLPGLGAPEMDADEHPTIQVDPALTMDMQNEPAPFQEELEPPPAGEEGPTLDQNPLLRPEDLFSDAQGVSGEAPLSDMSQEGQPIAPPDFGDARPLLTDPFGGEAPEPEPAAMSSGEAEAAFDQAFGGVGDYPPVQPSFDEVPAGGGAPVAPQAAPQATEGFWDPNYTSDEIQPGAVLLHQLEAQMHGAQSIESIGDLDDGSFDMLEQAFDEVARTPDTAAGATAEDALRQASAALAMSSATLPISPADVAASLPAPQAPATPPPLKRSVHLPHLTLSEETLAQCGLPIVDDRPTSTSEGNLALALTRGAEASGPSPVVATPPHTRGPVGTTAAEVEQEDKDDPSLSVEVPVVPSTFAGFTPLKVGGLVLLFLLVGAGLGALVAPKPKVDNSARAIAEQKFARGNQAFEEGRYDDALGFYRGAIATDRTYVDAYRAKAASLAKDPKRQSEAAAAYRKYLEVARAPADKDEVNAILARFESESGP